MNRISSTFERLKKDGKKGLVGYLTCGDPDAGTSLNYALTALRNGVDVLELGMPFSDPTADGPTIQAASFRALQAGMTLPKYLEMVREIRKESDAPIVLFGYVNPIFRYGYERLCHDAATAGADGLLIVDLPFEERDELLPHARKAGLDLIPLIAPTTPTDRAAKILKDASGFVYYIMVTGVTGARQTVVAGVHEQIERIQSCTTLPIAAGFGVSKGAQAREVAHDADAVVVGSALIQAAREGRLEALVKELRSALE